jgi:hypothetical protein
MWHFLWLTARYCLLSDKACLIMRPASSWYAGRVRLFDVYSQDAVVTLIFPV